MTVIIPTHNRPGKLTGTLSAILQQSLPATDYQIVVVDDGSVPAVSVVQDSRLKVVRLEGAGRSAARNAGARKAEGDLLIFIDDDISVGRDFLETHLHAHIEWPDALVVGSIRLPDEAVRKPFGRFRQQLEDSCLPQGRGPTTMPNFCTAANMSISRDLFQKLEGFDPAMMSSEDQDFALRHTARGLGIVFLPEATAIHRDTALDIRSYCHRAEWGSEQMIPFCQRYPGWPDNVERERVNGPVRLGGEPLLRSLRKIIKLGLTFKPVLTVLFSIASFLERVAPNSGALDRCYRLLLGIHIFRGYREGLKRSAIGDQQAAIKSKLTQECFFETDR